MGEADAGHEDRGPLNVGLIDDDGDPSAGVGAEGEADQQRGHLCAVEGGIAEQAVETLGASLFSWVERQGSGEGTKGQSPIAAARAAPKLEPGNGP